MATKKPSLRELPGYKIDALLGRGANGVVYRATQLSMQREVAIKFLSPKIARVRGHIDNFVKEARAAAKLCHPNIILGIDVGEHNGVYFFVMEYVEGKTLKEILAQRRQLHEPEALRLGSQIALALEHAQRHGIVHRDVKPANIIVTPDGTAKLCDLGLAVSLEEEPGRPRSFAGTPFYISPEQARCEPNIDFRADIYSLGATLYHALVGQPPFKGEASEHIIAHHLSDPPVPVRQRRPDLTHRTDELIRMMLQKDPSKRPQSPKALSDALLRAADHAERQRPQSRRRSAAVRLHKKRFNPVPLVVCAVLVLLGAAALFFFKKAPSRSDEATADGGPPRPVAPASEGSSHSLGAQKELGLLDEQVKADASFERVGDIIVAIERFKRKHGTAWGLKADLLKKDYLNALEEHVRPWFDTLQQQERWLLDQGQWHDALSVYDNFPEEFISLCPSGRAVKKRRAEIREKISVRSQKDTGKVGDLVQAGRLQEALDLLEVMAAYMPVKDDPWITRKRREIAGLMKGRPGKRHRDVEDAHTLLEADFRRLMAERKFGEAIRRVLDFVQGDWTNDQAAIVRVEGFDYAGKMDDLVARCENVIIDGPPTIGMACVLALRNAAEFDRLVKLAESAVDGLVERGEPITLTTYGATGFVRRASGGGVQFVTGERRRVALDILHCKVRDLDTLAARAPGVDREGTRHLGRVGLAYFYSGEQESLDRATDLLTKAADGGYPGARHYAKNSSRIRDQ